MKLAVVGIVFMAALGTLIYFGIREGKIPVVSIAEARSKDRAGATCRIVDMIIRSVERPGAPLEFTMGPEASPGQTLPVTSERTAPENFKVGNKVTVKGAWDAARGKFVADEVVTACPSRYKEASARGDAAPAERMP